MRLVASLVFGALSGVAAAFLHNAFTPWGLYLALTASGISIWLVGRLWGYRRYKIIAGAAWVMVLVRAGALGVGNELVVQGNSAGKTLLMAGIFMVIFVAALKP